jgi:hypothetical protein
MLITFANDAKFYTVQSVLGEGNLGIVFAVKCTHKHAVFPDKVGLLSCTVHPTPPAHAQPRWAACTPWAAGVSCVHRGVTCTRSSRVQALSSLVHRPSPELGSEGLNHPQLPLPTHVRTLPPAPPPLPAGVCAEDGVQYGCVVRAC